MKILILANNCKWYEETVDLDRINSLVSGAAGSCEIAVRHTSMTYIPLDEEGHINKIWYDVFVTGQARGYDIVHLHVTLTDWKKWGGSSKQRGIHIRDHDGIAETWAVGNKTTKVKRNDGKRYLQAQSSFEHELKHALYFMAGAKRGEDKTKYMAGYDNTHYFYEIGEMERAWDDIAGHYDKKKYIPVLEKAKRTLLRLLDILKSRQAAPSVHDFAEAIKHHEGWYPGSRAYRHNNPGNLRYSPFEDDNIDGYSYFDGYAKGYNALLHQINLAREGRSAYYRPDMTLVEFFSVWAPSSDDNDPDAYARAVARRLNVPTSFTINNLRP